MGYTDIGNKKSEFVAKTQLHWKKCIIFRKYKNTNIVYEWCIFRESKKDTLMNPTV